MHSTVPNSKINARNHPLVEIHEMKAVTMQMPPISSNSYPPRCRAVPGKPAVGDKPVCCCIPVVRGGRSGQTGMNEPAGWAA